MVKLTKTTMREIGARGRLRIIKKLEDARIKMSDPEYRKKYPLYPAEEKELLEFLEEKEKEGGFK